MADYTYLFCDLISGEVLAELPLNGVNFTLPLNNTGTFSGNLFLGDPTLDRIDWLDATAPARTAVYVDRDGTIVWGGPLWQRNYDSDTMVLTLNASDVVSYLSAIRMAGKFLATNKDQFQIVRDLIATMNAVDGHHPTILVAPATGLSGVTRTFAISAPELKRYADILGLVTQPADGIDYTATAAYSTDGRHVPQCGMVMAYPHNGRTANLTQLMFSFPGNLRRYTWPEDGTAGPATDLAEIGAGNGTAQLESHRTNSALLGGYPHLWTVNTHTDITHQALLDGFADADIARLAQPVTLPTLTLNNTTDPHLGDWTAGDWCRVQLADERFPQGTDQQFRILTTTVTPGEDGDETVVLTLGQY